jgi:hypothetical protein
MSTVPFALVGGFWLIWILGHAVSVATAVGFTALAGVAAEFGVVMLLYLKEALNRRLEAGEPLTEALLFDAIREGAVLRVRPKAMTVAVVLAGLIPIMVGHGAGSEVMQRIAAPMVGGMVRDDAIRNRHRTHARAGPFQHAAVHTAAPECEILFLRRQPVGHEQRCNRRSLCNPLHRCAGVKVVDVARDARLHDVRARFVELRGKQPKDSTPSAPMKGDIPGVSKCWFGTIGSCQYSTLRPVFGSVLSPVADVMATAVESFAEARQVPAT